MLLPATISSNDVAPVPPLPIASVPVTSFVESAKSIVTSNLPPENAKAVSVAKSTAKSFALATIPLPPTAFKVLPDFVKPLV